VEKAVCAAPDLSTKDEAMAARYKAALEGLGDEGRETLRKAQRGWLKFVRTVCGPDLKESETHTRRICLTSAYDRRIEDLGKAVQRKGGYVFSRFDHYEARKTKDAEDRWGAYPGWETRQLSFPRIDQPANPAAKAWNRLTDERAQSAVAEWDEGQDEEINFKINLASPVLVSVSFTNWTYPHGAAHGMWGTGGIHMLMEQGRLLKAEDVFDRTKPWVTALAKMCDAALRKMTQDNPEAYEGTPVKLAEMVADPTSWEITETGMDVVFPPYSVGPYSLSGETEEFPWTALKPYLVAHPPVPVAR
ncbi:MAG: lysozyme inhibitor LprI family protein, partial [Rhodospirillales bacterium]|nr:lysozyme inhibitor LprI family protein [Rhodospirillales bacterium]